MKLAQRMQSTAAAGLPRRRMENTRTSVAESHAAGRDVSLQGSRAPGPGLGPTRRGFRWKLLRAAVAGEGEVAARVRKEAFRKSHLAGL